MSKSYLDKLHLSRNFIKNSSDTYTKHLNGLNNLKPSDLKKYLYIYEFIYNELLLYIYPIVKKSLLEISVECERLFVENSNILDYFNSRIKESDLSMYIDLSIYKDWFDNIQIDIYENYSENERLDIFVKCLNLIILIDYLLVLKDEYWSPRHAETILRMNYMNYKFEKVKERIWQPKTK